VRLFLCDDDTDLPILLGAWLEDEPTVDLIDDTPNETECIARIGSAAADVLLLDHRGVEDAAVGDAVEAVRRAAPGCRVILYSGFPDDLLAAAAVASGADGHLAKSASRDEFIAAVQSFGPIPPRAAG
jgi:DNA-binding NarL/FixJ family response regulator